LPCQDATSGLPAGSRSACEDAADLHGYRSLLECLEVLPDPRRRHGRRHRLAVALAFAVAAVMADADSVTAISERSCDVPPEVLVALGAWRDRRRDRGFRHRGPRSGGCRGGWMASCWPPRSAPGRKAR
jgi:hypothetical protein